MEPASRVLLEHVSGDSGRVEGALRHLDDNSVEVWSRAAYGRFHQPAPVRVTVYCKGHGWSGSGVAATADAGAVRVRLEGPLALPDRRRFQRFRVAWPITLTWASQVISAVTFDVSMGGFRCRPLRGTPTVPRDGTWLAAAIDYQRAGFTPFVAIAVVRGIDEYGWRCQFTNLPDRMGESLHHAIRDAVRTGHAEAC